MSKADWAVIIYCIFLWFVGGVGFGIAIGLNINLRLRRALSEQEKPE